jgi:hypothetical protein
MTQFNKHGEEKMYINNNLRIQTTYEEGKITKIKNYNSSGLLDLEKTLIENNTMSVMEIPSNYGR